MTRIALLAAVVATSLIPVSAFAKGGGGGGGGGGHAGGGSAGGHPAAHAGAHPHSAGHHSGASSHQGKASAKTSNASSSTASRPGNHAGPSANQFAKDHPRRNEVNHRDREQLARVAEGLKSGKLTPTQAKQILSNDRSIKQQEHADVKANGGFLTKSQQRQINQEENANSRLIHNDTHPASPAAAVPASASRPGNPIGAPGSRFADQHPRRDEVNSRVGDQRARVEQAVKSGKLTPSQAKQLLANDQAIKQQEHAEVKANGGFLTKSQQRQINQEENANSRLIRNDEHPASPATAVPVSASRPGNPIGAPGSRFAEQHPRRDEVNSRVGDQRARIAEGLKSGKLTPTEAKQLLANDQAIKQQEHAEVKANGGFLTKSQQRQLNHEESADSRLIRKDERASSP